MYQNIIISDSLCNFSLRSFCMMTNTTVLSIVPIGCEYGSTCFSSVYVINISVSLTVVKEGAVSVFIRI
jgi:hypothetical protein